MHNNIKYFTRLALSIGLFFSFQFPPCNHVCAQNTDALDDLVEETEKSAGMNHATIAVCVYNIKNNKALYSHNSQRSMIPGSVEKVFTTGVGFAQLGSHFRFTTKLGMTGSVDRDGVLHGNIYIEGGGDPLLGSYRYKQTQPDSLFDGWMTALYRKGVRRVDGRVCYNIGIFDEQILHDTWEWGDVGNYYAAGVNGLNFHENMFFVYFNPGKQLGYPASVVDVRPKNLDIVGTCEVTTGPVGSGDNVTIYGSPISNARLYRGTVPIDKKNFAVRGAMPNPARNCADMFATYLRTRGMTVSSNSMQVYTRPDSLRSVIDQYSSEYYTIAQYTNLTSNNIYAESIYKYLGYKRYGQGSFDNGSKALMDYFNEKGLDVGGVRILDGSGLSRGNRVTADFLCRYLTAVSREHFYEDFRQSLSKAGENGTAKNMLPDLPAGTSVYVKTGTLDGVRAYAGYVVTDKGETLAFSVISNGHECSSKQAAAKLNKILFKIATLY